MSFLRKILYPFSVIYGGITSVRNKLYDKGVLKATKFTIPVIVVGNLSVGGTGKSPQIEYLIRLLKDDHKIAVLSRGYLRKSKGYQLADTKSTVADIGDEPMQFYTKFKDEILVAVDNDRVNGIKQLQEQHQPDIILLDDAYQHRRVEAGFNILLTPYDKLYVDDRMLPAGELREKVQGASRAQVIIVTKCPDQLSEEHQFEITKKLNVELHQTVFFTKIRYNDAIISNTNKIALNELKDYEILLVTGIAKTQPLTDFLSNLGVNFIHKAYKDHHNFSENDRKQLTEQFSKLESAQKLILTTEKDYVRSFVKLKDVYYLPIRTEFLEHHGDFDSLIAKYIASHSA